MELSDHGGALRIGVELDVVANPVGRPESADSPNAELLLLHDRLEDLQGVLVKLCRLGPDFRIGEEAGVAAPHLPRGKEGGPIEVLNKLGEGNVVECQDSSLLGHGKIGCSPVDRGDILTGDFNREQFPLGSFPGVFLTETLMVGLHLEMVGLPAILREKLRRNADHARGIEHMNDGMVIFPGDLHRRVSRTRRGSSDQEWDIELCTLHLTGDVDHLVEGGGNKAAQTDNIDLVLAGGGQDLVARNHDAEVDHFVAVAGKDNADDVLTDVVDIPLDRGHENLFCGTGIGCGRFLGLHEGGEEGDRLLHDSGTLHNLR